MKVNSFNKKINNCDVFSSFKIYSLRVLFQYTIVKSTASEQSGIDIKRERYSKCYY